MEDLSSADGPKLAPAPFRVAPPGTAMVWTRLDGFKTERGSIGRVEPDKLIHFVWEGEPRSMYLFGMRCLGPNTWFDHAAYERIFPLEVGKSVAFARTVSEWRWENRISVTGTERLTLAFGDVDTYVVVCETEGLNNPFHARNAIWHAPNVGWNVKFRYSDSRGQSYSWKAVKFIPPH